MASPLIVRGVCSYSSRCRPNPWPYAPLLFFSLFPGSSSLAPHLLKYVSPPASDAAGQANSPTPFPRSALYPDIEPFATGMLDVGDGHSLYWEQCGNPNGIPAVFLHGGPGAGCDERSRRFFDPSVYRIVIFDQRGSGRSTPNAANDLAGSLVAQNTAALVQDIEQLREALEIPQWGLVLGGSWGSTLALAYAQQHPSMCRAIVLRGVFLFGADEVDYLFSKGGTYGQNPAAWETYKRFIQDTSDDWEAEQHELLEAYWRRLSSEDANVREAAAAAFVGYELSISKTFIDPAVIEKYLGTPSVLIPFAVMEVHYMRNAGFLRPQQLLSGAQAMVHHGHRVSIVHGRADYVCQPHAAYRLSLALEEAGAVSIVAGTDEAGEQCAKEEGATVELEFIAGAGHSDSEPGIADALIRVTDKLRPFLLSK